jgi:zinc protease
VSSAQLWFDAGAVDEEPEIAGAAHFVEHLVFKGTERRGVGESAAAIEGLGGDLNAWTSWDDTCFHATLEARQLGEGLDVLFDMVGHARLDPAELEREKLVVLEEIRSYQDDPDSVVADRVQELLFPAHPYGRPVIGHPKTVSALDRETVQAFIRRHYSLSRATLAVAGPLELDEICALAEPLTGSWADGQPRRAVPPAEQAVAGSVERLARDFGSAVVQLAWPGPGIGHPDLAALDVLFAALGQGAASRLAVLLDLDRGIASHTWADTQVQIGGGFLAAGFMCGETEPSIVAAVEDLVEVGRNGVTAAQVLRARDGLLADRLFAHETAEGVAADLAWNLARMGDPRADEVYAGQLAAVTARQVREVARRWLRPERMQLVVLDRSLDVRRVRNAVRKLLRPAKRAAASGPYSEVVRGVRIVGLPERSEIAAIHAIGVGGQLVVDPAHAGLSEAWSRTLLRGTESLDAVAFAERSDALGLDLDAGAGRSSWSIDATFPAPSTADAVQLLGEMLVAPGLEPADWDNVRKEMLDDREALEDRPAAVASELLWARLWPDHPWRLPSLGTARSLSRIGPRGLRRYHVAQVARDNLVIAVGGGLDPEKVTQALEPFLAELPARSALPARAPPSARRPGGARTAGNEQATVLVGVRGVKVDDPQRTALSVASYLLDAQSGRLFLELRERLGLAYGVWASSETGLDGGVFSAGLSTDPDRVEEARDRLLDSLRRLATDGPADDELARVKRMVRGLAAMRLQRVAARVSDLAFATRFGVPYGLAALEQRLAEVSPRTIVDALGRIGLADPIQVVVRPRPGGSSTGAG